MGPWTLTSIHMNIWPAAVWTTPAGHIRMMQKSQETQPTVTPSQTIWLHHSKVHLWSQTSLKMNSSSWYLAQRTDYISPNQHQSLQATFRLCVGTEGLGSDTSYKEEIRTAMQREYWEQWKTNLIANECVLCNCWYAAWFSVKTNSGIPSYCKPSCLFGLVCLLRSILINIGELFNSTGMYV